MLRSNLRIRPLASSARESLTIPSSRSLYEGKWGWIDSKEYIPKLPDFTVEELANRAKNSSLLRLVESYRRHGHRAARLDPLDLMKRNPIAALDPRRYGFEFTSASLRPEFISETLPPVVEQENTFDTTGIMDFPSGDGLGSTRTIEEIASQLSAVYCEGIGYEFHHMPSKHERRFLEKLLEKSHAAPVSTSEALAQWKLLSNSENFDHWCAKKFPNVKRYGLEGGESMMVALGTIFAEAEKVGTEDVVLAMPHRGRLNVLTQLLDLDMRLLVRKMRGLPTLPPSLPKSQFTDDVLSHLFITSKLDSGLKVHLLPNPSHLEAVTGVGLGFARGLQIPFGSLESSTSFSSSSPPSSHELGTKVISVSCHGDGAFIGQGVVSEALNLASLPHFTVGGSIRIVVNNQLGYTANATEGRTSHYATDMAKSISALCLHVNGDRIDDVARAMKLAVAFQQKFKKDVVIDLVVYRRRGHNELDNFEYTSPIMYQKIATLPSVLQSYETSLIEKGTLDTTTISKHKSELNARLDSSLNAALPENYKVPELEMPRSWSEMKWPLEGEWMEPVITGVNEETLRMVGKQSVTTPENFDVNHRLTKMHIARRLANLESGKGLDFATAEAMAFGSLMIDGKHIRLTGQDSGRGTFSQRHAIISDQTSNNVCVPLQSLADNGEGKVGTFEIVNSPLSEYAVIGFEQGLSYVSPNILPIWEAQFGDFLNTAQVAIDTYFVSGETKWGMQTALTLLLPGGYDGAGPEHSSARIERFLQLTNEPLDSTPFVPNVHLVNITTPAQYFHVLRRQLVREYRKPLAVVSPKGILRLPAATSPMSDLTEGTSFQSVLVDPFIVDDSKVKRVVYLSGKMYYDLIKERADRKLDESIAFIRIEEISPFPYQAIEKIHQRVKHVKSVVYAQEEPENAGSYLFISPRLKRVTNSNVEYIGRVAMATPAPGVSSYFLEQKKEIFEKVFRGL